MAQWTQQCVSEVSAYVITSSVEKAVESESDGFSRRRGRMHFARLYGASGSSSCYSFKILPESYLKDLMRSPVRLNLKLSAIAYLRIQQLQLYIDTIQNILLQRPHCLTLLSLYLSRVSQIPLDRLPWIQISCCRCGDGLTSN